MSDYRRNYNREDPRLARQNSVPSPKTKPPVNNGPPADNWNTQTATYNHSQALQNAYQSLSYNNAATHQYPTQTYYTGYQNYSYNPYENFQATQQQQYNMNVGGEPRPPGEEYPHTSWTSSNSYATAGAQAQPPPQEYSTPAPVPVDVKKSDAVAEEKLKHLASLVKERETYEERVASLKQKLKLLVDQKETLSSKHSPDKDTLRIIKENTKLQVEIQTKMKDASSVIDFLSNLIGDKEKKSKSTKVEEPKDLLPASGEKVNMKHYDPEIHWCRMCDVFPHSAKEHLLHLHSKSHRQSAHEEMPWHKLPPEPKFPVYEEGATKRVPIKGLQFFVASTAWYCRLCDTWIGDLHCASQHLMSVPHSQNYSNFVEQNPHWEIEWMKDREKALERTKRGKGVDSDSDSHSKRRKRREKYSPTTLAGKEKKKKKRSKRRKKMSSDESSSSSSSSSSSDDEEEADDKSKSIRVAMRNKLLESDGKLDILEQIVRQQGKKEEFVEDKLMSQWMTTTNEPAGKDKQLLDNLKEKLKQKQDAEKAKVAYEAELAKRKQEFEDTQRKEKERLTQEALAKEEEKKQREKMSLKFRNTNLKDTVPRKRTPSRSPDRGRRRRSRSPSPRRPHHRNGRNSYERSPPPRRDRNRRSRSRGRERSRERAHKSRSKSRERRSSSRDKKTGSNSKKLPFIGRMPLFKNIKPKERVDAEPKREIQKEDYDAPRKTRFQPGNLARAFIPQPEVVCFPQLSSYPPMAEPPPPPVVITPPAPPQAPKISKKPPPPPKLDEPPPAPKLPTVTAAAMESPKIDSKAERALQEAAREEAVEEEPDDKEEEAQQQSEMAAQVDASATEDYLLYEDTSNTMYQYGAMDYNMMYQQGYNYMQPATEEAAEPEPPKSHTMPLEPPPLPPDDPNEDLAMLGLSSDDLAVQQMY